MKAHSYCLRVAGLLVICLLAGCAGISTKLAPVYSILDGTPSHYTVKKGDTLYSIAFRYGLDYKTVANINGIKPPYTIFVDQRLRLSGSARAPAKDSGPTRVADSGRTKKQQKVAKKVDTLPTGVPNFRWPVEGRILRGFSLDTPVNKGIDIAASEGQTVKAAADGVVVYAGGNLRGYGNLVILKHNDNYLSAYGNNARMMVKEGDLVKSGKSIGRVGVNAANEAMLHFEIRRDGKPRNPLTYLPKQG